MQVFPKSHLQRKAAKTTRLHECLSIFSLFEAKQKHRATAGTVSLTRTIISASSRRMSMHAGMKITPAKFSYDWPFFLDFVHTYAS